MFSCWKTKPRAGRKCCSRLTPATAPKSPPFISMWPLQSPQPGKYLPPLAWPGPVGGGKNSVLNVTALRARDVSRRQETPGPGSAARPCHGNSPARGGGWGGSARVKAMEVLGSRVLPLPRAGPFPVRRGAGRGHCHTICLAFSRAKNQGKLHGFALGWWV